MQIRSQFSQTRNLESGREKGKRPSLRLGAHRLGSSQGHRLLGCKSRVIHSCNKYSLNTCYTCWALGNKAMNQKDKVPAFLQFNFYWGQEESL